MTGTSFKLGSYLLLNLDQTMYDEVGNSQFGIWLERILLKASEWLFIELLLHIRHNSRANLTTAIETRGRYNVSDLTHVDSVGDGEY